MPIPWIINSMFYKGELGHLRNEASKTSRQINVNKFYLYLNKNNQLFL